MTPINYHHLLAQLRALPPSTIDYLVDKYNHATGQNTPKFHTIKQLLIHATSGAAPALLAWIKDLASGSIVIPQDKIERFALAADSKRHTRPSGAPRPTKPLSFREQHIIGKDPEVLYDIKHHATRKTN